ncbi:MAG: hypothetical protein AAB354_09205, partial [candidate division KSB1 bacterium]
MINKHFDPTKFIDREFESELFEELLKFESPARILTICDKGGMGKRQLLEKSLVFAAERLTRMLVPLRAASQRVALMRLVIVLAGIFAALAAAIFINSTVAWLVLGIALAIFIGVAIYHRRLDTR